MNTADSQSKHPRWQAFVRWLEPRTGLASAVEACRASESAKRGVWWNVWMSVTLCALLMQAISGFFLWLHYSPSAQTAWESVYYLQYEVTGGWLLRGLHHWTAQILVALLVVYVSLMILRGIYRAPRELVFWSALVLALLALALCLTGDLLSWDQNGYASTKTRVSFLMLLPWIGEPLYRLAIGGPAFGHLALTRFFALHIACAAGLIGIYLFHAWFAYRAALAAAPVSGETSAQGTSAAGPSKRCCRCCSDPRCHGLACLALLVLALLFVFKGALGDHAGQVPADYLGVALGAPADRDPANFYAAARPEWSFRGLYGFSNAFPGELKILPIFVFSTLFLVLVFLMPLIAYIRVGHAFNLLVFFVLAGGLSCYTYQSVAHDRGDADYHAALKAGEEDAARVKCLVRGPDGIPAAGALAVLRNDPKSQGPKLWKQQCAVCHDYQDPSGKVAPTKDATAPDLLGFASRAWIAGFMDPKQIGGPKYLGNTRFATGVMVRYVEERFAKLKTEDRQAIIAALSAEARLASQAAQDKQDVALIDKGRKLLASNECARCHRFYDAGKAGSAPDLTGYGSRDWILGLLADPTHASFYGLRNDRMPAYVESPAQPEKNRLQADQIGLITDWLRGEWYEPAAESCCPAPEAKPVKTPVLLALGTWQARAVKQEKAPANNPAAEAQVLYKQEHCAICHPRTGAPGGDIKSDNPSAPDLGGFASRAWIAGLLDPKQVDGPKYYGNSSFKKMSAFVKGNLKELKKDVGEKEFEKLVAALAAEAQRNDAKPAAKPAAGEDAAQLFEDFTCSDCHKFYGKGKIGGAPDLTGYGSREWLIGILSDPTNARFYGDKNDGMPSYAKSADHPQKNLLTAPQLGALADWLRDQGAAAKPEAKPAGK